MGNVYMEADQVRYKGQYRTVQEALDNGGGGGGTSDYAQLTNKPKINNVELSGSKSLADLGIQGALTAGDGISIINNVISATGGGSMPVTLRVMNILSVNDANSIDTSFTAKKTGPYLLIYGFGSPNADPDFTTDDIKVNGDSVTTGIFYSNGGPGVATKYAALDLTANDVVSVAAYSGAGSSNTSALAVLLKLSAPITNIATAAGSASVTGSGLLELEFDINSDGLYMPFLFTRMNGVGAFQSAYHNDTNLKNSIVTCSLGTSWQLTLALTTISAANGDTVELAASKNGVTALGVLSFDLDV